MPFILPQQFQGPVFLVQEGLAALSQSFRGILVEKFLYGLPLFVMLGGQQAQAQDQELGQDMVLGKSQTC
jgi:hypothetical protein